MKQKVSASVVAVRDVASDVRLIEFAFPDDALVYEAGGHLDIEIPLESGVQFRSYSLVEPVGHGGIRIAVKRMPNSRGGSAYMWQLASGARATLWPAPNNFPVTYTGGRYLLVAGGIGITPIIGIARSLRQARKPFRFVYIVRSFADAAFRDTLAEEFPAEFHLHDDSAEGLIDVEALVNSVDAETVAYICGPLGLMEAFNRAWHARNLPQSNLRFESFGNSGRRPTTSFTVRIEETGTTVTVPENMSMLDALVEAGQPIMFDCRRGECGLCKVEIVAQEGEVDHRDVFFSDEERARGKAMCACVSRIYGTGVTVRINAITHGREGGTHTQ